MSSIAISGVRAGRAGRAGSRDRAGSTDGAGSVGRQGQAESGPLPGGPKSMGQALVEFALITPIFLALLLMAIDFGRVFFTYVEIDNAAREAAAYAAANPTDLDGMLARAQQETNVQGQAGQGAVSVSAACAGPGGGEIDCGAAAGGSGTGNTVTVTATDQFSFLTPFVGSFWGSGLTISASSTVAVLDIAPGAGGGVGACGTQPAPSFTVTVNDLTVQLDASASSPQTGACAISGYNWDMGDGKNPNPPIVGMNATYTYSDAGGYIVQLTVTNPAGARSTSETVVVGLPTPSPSATDTPVPTVAPTPTPAPTVAPPVCNVAPTFTSTFTGVGNGVRAHETTFYGGYTGQPAPGSWSWNFGDGSTGSGQTVAHDYSSPGTYTVTLTVRNGSCSAVVSAQVAVQ
jgi:PKD repeat protein